MERPTYYEVCVTHLYRGRWITEWLFGGMPKEEALTTARQLRAADKSLDVKFFIRPC